MVERPTVTVAVHFEASMVFSVAIKCQVLHAVMRSLDNDVFEGLTRWKWVRKTQRQTHNAYTHTNHTPHCLTFSWRKTGFERVLNVTENLTKAKGRVQG